MKKFNMIRIHKVKNGYEVCTRIQNDGYATGSLDDVFVFETIDSLFEFLKTRFDHPEKE